MPKKIVLSIICVVTLVVFGLQAGIAGAWDPVEKGAYDFDYEAFDLGGRTVSIVTFTEVRETRFRDLYPGLIEEAEETFNANIEFVIMEGDRTEFMVSRLMAGDADYDIWDVHTGWYWDLVAEGAVLPLNDIVPDGYYDALPEMHQGSVRGMEHMGNTYGFGMLQRLEPNVVTVALYNVDLFEDEGLPDPYELYQRGEWTWEAATEIALDATRDTTGDGEIDQWGLGIDVPEMFIYSNEARFEYADEDGRIQVAVAEEPFIEAMQQMYDWREEYQVWDGSTWNFGPFTAGNAAMHIAIPAYRIASMAPEMEDHFRVVPMPMGPSANDHQFPGFSVGAAVLPVSAEEPLALVALEHFLNPPEVYQPAEFFRRFAQDRESLEVLLLADERTIPGRLYQPIFWGQASGAFWEGINTEASPATVMSEVLPEAQAVVDEMFDQ